MIKFGHAPFLFQIASQSQFSQFFPCNLLDLRSGVMGLVSFPAPFSSPSPDNEGSFELTWGHFTNTGILSSAEAIEESSHSQLLQV